MVPFGLVVDEVLIVSILAFLFPSAISVVLFVLYYVFCLPFVLLLKLLCICLLLVTLCIPIVFIYDCCFMLLV